MLAIILMTLAACDTPPPTPLPTSTSAPTPTPPPTITVVLTIVPTQTPESLLPSAPQILDSAVENLRRQASFHVSAVIETSTVTTTIEADVVPPNRGYVREQWTSGLAKNVDEFLFIDDSRYSRPPGFGVWFDYSGTTWSRRTVGDFPYNLDFLGEEVGELALQGSEEVEGAPAYRIIGVASRRLEVALGFDVGARLVNDASVAEMWISRNDLLPLRIEVRFDSTGDFFEAVYSDFGSGVDVSAPEEVLDLDYLQGLLDGTLDAEEKGLMVSVFPPEGQVCVEEEIGVGPYRELVSGASELDDVLLWVLDHCEWEVFSFSDNFARSGLAEVLYSLDLTVLTIPRGDMAGELAECVRGVVGLEALFEVGWGERPPTPEEVDAAEMCVVAAVEEEVY